MKKEAQEQINVKVMTTYYAMIKEVAFSQLQRRLRSSQAYVLETEHFYVLKSYDTTVACIYKQTNEMYDFLRAVFGYTLTSARHISKFREDYTPYPWDFPVYTWREV